MQLPKGRISSLGQQFMPITQLKGLESSDYPGHTVDEVTKAEPMLDGSHKSIVSTGQHHDMDQLRKDVAEHGITEPLYVSDNGHSLGNGHHRAQVAIEQGHMFVPTTNHHPEGVAWSPQTYRGSRKLSPPSRTWEPLIQEHEAAHAEPPTKPMQVEGQQQLFQTRFNDRRTHG